MAYLEQGNWRDRPGALAAAIAIQGGIVLALANGLTIGDIIPTEDERIIGVNIEDDPIVEPVDDPKPQPEKSDPRPFVPDQPFDFDTARPIIDPIPLPPPGPDPFTFDPTPAPKPSLGFDPVTAKARNDPAGWVTTNDYPARDIRQENEGITGFRVVVGTDGRVKSCEITASSGFASLDRATCRNVEKRARFDAAKDANGEKIVGTYSHKVLWQIPD